MDELKLAPEPGMKFFDEIQAKLEPHLNYAMVGAFTQPSVFNRSIRNRLFSLLLSSFFLSLFHSFLFFFLLLCRKSNSR